MSIMLRTVAIYLFDEIELLDLGGPFEVFSTASRMKARLAPDAAKPFEVFTIADSIRPIRAHGGLVVQPSFYITNHLAIDVLIVPGGVETAELERASVIEWIERSAATAELIASVSTGAFLLGKAGVLRGKTITTRWEDIEDFRARVQCWRLTIRMNRPAGVPDCGGTTPLFLRGGMR